MERETSLGKALRLLIAVGESSDPAGIGVAELVLNTGLSRPTAYRFLNELKEFGLVSSATTRPVWQLGPKVMALAAMAGNWAVLRRRAKTAMDDFVRRTGHTVHLGLRDGMEIVYIDKSESTARAALSSAIGQRQPLNTTALGKCLVAFDPNPRLAELVVEHGLVQRTPHSITTRNHWLEEIARVRQERLAYDNEENFIGVRCVAAPIRDGQGFAVAAVSLSGIAGGPGDDAFRTLAAELQATANQLGPEAA